MLKIDIDFGTTMSNLENWYRFRYTHEGLADLQVFKNGVGMPQNEILSNMDLTDENSYAVDYLYKQMLQNFPNASKSISRKRYKVMSC